VLVVPAIRLISWNVNTRVRCLPEQVAAHVARQPDIVALQEVTRTTAAPLSAGLAAGGLVYATDSFQLAPPDASLTGRRRYGELIASRWPLRALSPDALAIPWPERVLSALIASPAGEIEFHTTYIPPGAPNGQIKLDTLDGLYRHLAVECGGQRILCGDLNAPQAELPDGTVATFGQGRRRNGTFGGWRSWGDVSGQEWDRAERAIVTGLADSDLADAFRAVHGYTVQDSSWFWTGLGKQVGYRLDHAFASASLRPIRAEYLHPFRTDRLSDHSPLEVDFFPAIVT
jgi:exonuclease III